MRRTIQSSLFLIFRGGKYGTKEDREELVEGKEHSVFAMRILPTRQQKEKRLEIIYVP